jgi:aquaporin Z
MFFMKTGLVELVGTFFLVFVIGLTIVPPNVGPFAPLAIGAALAALVYAGGRFYNPAVTLAIWIRGKYTAKEAVVGIIMQIVGGIAAAFVINYIRVGEIHAATTPVARDAVKLFVTEFLFTFVLSYVILQVATSSKTAGNAYYGIAVGLTVVAASYAAAPISGAEFNPAVASAGTIVGLISAGDLWLCLGANFIGGAIAAIVYRFVSPEEFQK